MNTQNCGEYTISQTFFIPEVNEGVKITVIDAGEDHLKKDKYGYYEDTDDLGADISVKPLLKASVEDPSNEEFSIQLGLDIIRAIAWQEWAGWVPPPGESTPRWNHYDSNGQPIVSGSDWGIMQINKTAWEAWFAREYDPDYKPHGYTVCEWNEMAWNWETNIANGKYIHQTYMYEKQNATQKTWPDTAPDKNTPNREDLATYGYHHGDPLMKEVTSDSWSDDVVGDTYTQNVRTYKAEKPWE